MPIGNNGYNLSLGGYCTPWYDFSTMYPNTLLGVQNDIGLCNLGLNVDSLEQQALKTKSFEELLAKQQRAAITSQWQQMNQINTNNQDVLSRIFGALDLSGLANLNQQTTLLNNNVKRIPEGKIIDALKRMGSGTLVADRINQEIIIKENGNDKTITILDRLTNLVDEYRKDPDNAELSKANFGKIWDIASRYMTNGDISSDDFATLKRIALNPIKDADAVEEEQASEGSKKPEDKTKPEEEEKPEEEQDKKAKRSDNYESSHSATGKDAARANAQRAYNAIDGMWTDKEDLRIALSEKNTDKYNIIEFLDGFDDIDSEGQGFIYRFWDDFDRYDNDGQAWYHLRDNAKPFLDPTKTISPIYKLNERVKDLAGKENISEQDKKSLKAKADKLISITKGLENSKGLGSVDDANSDKAKHIAAFNDLVAEIKRVEEICYGRDE